MQIRVHFENLLSVTDQFRIDKKVTLAIDVDICLFHMHNRQYALNILCIIAIHCVI